MVDEHSRKVLHHFLEPFLDVEPDGYTKDGLMDDVVLRQGLCELVNHNIYTPEQLAIKLAQVEKVAFPACRLKKFMKTGKWPKFIDVG